jgi:hypothetical protein
MERRKIKRITLTSDSINPPSEKEFVEATIAFANGAELEVNGYWPRSGENPRFDKSPTGDDNLQELIDLALAVWKAHELKDKLDQQGKKLDDKYLRIITTAQERPPYMPTLAAFRSHLRKCVCEILSLSFRDPAAAADFVLEHGLIQGFPYISFRNRYSLGQSAGGLRLNTEYTFTNFSDAVLLGVVLMLDERRGFREKLCQCQWEPCGLFFFEIKPPTGRPQRKYCCSEHMLKAHDLNAANRMKKFRSKPARKHK